MEAGQAALLRGDWRLAQRTLAAVLASEDTPEARLGLGTALWWLGEFAESLDHRERAYAQLCRRGERTTAALVAIWLAIAYKAGYGNLTAARGWTSRAERLLEGIEGPPRGWLLLARSTQAAADNGERLARHALEAGRRFADVDLELCALAQVGAHQVAQGRVDEGLTRLEEATAAALGGEARDLTTAVFTACLMMIACAQCADLERAVQWCRAADRFTERYGAPYLFAWCRTVYGGVLVSLGQWAEGERELRFALAASEGTYRPVHVEATATLARLCVRRGRIEEAAALLSGLDADPGSAAAVGELQIAQGQPQVAACMLRRRLEQLSADELGATPLVELLVEADVATGDLLEANELAERLSSLATLSGRDTAVARAQLAHGRVRAALDDAEKARHELQGAMEGFLRVEMPFEAARARLELARVVAVGSQESAIAEAHGALVAFDRLGAKHHADAAAALSRSLGGRPRTGPRNAPGLTPRQAEVLELLAGGLSNPEIANRLYISRKTVEHHVESILSKLGLRSRAQAVVYAIGSPRSENGGAHPCSPDCRRSFSPSPDGDDDRELDG